MSKNLVLPIRPERKFLSNELEITSWEILKPFFEDLKERQINSKEELEKWLQDRSELEAVLAEDLGWRYIKMTIDTTREELLENYKLFVGEINPKMAPYDDLFNKKMIDSPYINELDKDKYFIFFRSVKQQIELFTEKNIDLFAELSQESQKFGAISGAQTINYEDEDITLQKASTYIKKQDRKVREEVYKLISSRRLEDKDKLNELFTSLIKKRHQVAINAGFENFRDYKFKSLGRFDYTVQDCLNFHDSIASEVVPLRKEDALKRKEILGLDKLKPFDTEVDLSGKPALKPFENGSDLIDKTINIFSKIRPYYGECLETMKQMGHLDLESKNGKSPGGYNYPLYEIGVPFIFMNSVGTQRDLVTMVHEGGHAIHSFLSRDLENTDFKSLPSEVAELASMSMELISMEYWDEFYTDKDELRRAKKEQLEKLFMILPWIATIDAFQHWIYENPNHSDEERTEEWLKIQSKFGSEVVDYEGFEANKEIGWQGQLHLYEVPFYYIEYGMAQLGAIAMWRNYKQNPEKALDGYEAALKLGYTKTIPEIYETAGIKFDFSQAYVKELMDFVKVELEKLA